MEHPHIKIGPQVYEIESVKDLHEGDVGLDGGIYPWESKIYLEERLVGFPRRCVLWHEIIHGILIQAGLENKKDDGLIDALAYGIMGVLQDNSWLGEK